MSARRNASTGPIPVYLEQGRRRVFAVAVEWPGWSRAGRDHQSALDALAAYLARYRIVTEAAGIRGLPSGAPDDVRFDVVEHVPGNATTDFGAPGVVPKLDHRDWTRAEADRQARLVGAAWARLDDVAAGAPGQLRKGPRGGGRDRDAIVEHVRGAEHAFVRKAGLRIPAPKDHADTGRLREQFLELLRAEPNPDDAGRAWPLPYAARRVAWHALDHAWEIEDRSGADPAD